MDMVGEIFFNVMMVFVVVVLLLELLASFTTSKQLEEMRRNQLKEIEIFKREMEKVGKEAGKMLRDTIIKKEEKKND